jgi:sulfoxide reductase catalytic subunit YedY
MPAIHLPRRFDLPERLATPESVYLDRRRLLAALGFGGLALALPTQLACGGENPGPQPDAPLPAAELDPTQPALGDRFAGRFPAERNPLYTLPQRPLTDERTAATHNNFYEFTVDKSEVWRLAQGFSVEPWKVEVAGLVAKPRTLDLDDLFTRFPLEERLYRFRCVEAWAMQVPWTGYPLAQLIDFLEPLSSARYIRFVSLLDRDRLPGQRSMRQYPWPYYEALRLDEARNPLAFVVVGVYGHALPMQHGAPWRLAIPWKYGYKGPKSVVRIEFTAERPGTFWNDAQPKEYGFFSNVDPTRPHPRWSQATEHDIGTGERRPTLPYNGYGDEVADLYSGDEI